MLKKLRLEFHHIVALVSFLVGFYGLFIITSTLLDQFSIHRLRFVNSFTIDVHIVFGLGFIYLSLLLLRRKKNALYLALTAFTFLLVDGVAEIVIHPNLHKFNALIVGRYIALPLVIMGSLIVTHDEFKVKSDQQAFTNSLRLAVIVFIITFAYGVSGFMLMAKTDFHQEIGFTSALYHTADQFDLFSNHPLKPYTKRARLFNDSLSFVSLAAIGYLIISLFQPVRARLIDQSDQRDRLKIILDKYGALSEDFFKLWPKDKHYFFESKGEAAIAYQTRHGVALVLGDPVGNKKSYASLFSEFSDMCWSNDWQPALIHVDERFIQFYKDLGFQLQLIGQEAFVNIEHFVAKTSRNKYFRNIKNRFNKENFSFEVLEPPHHQAVLTRMQAISDDWLSKPGRTERGFVMGYYSEEYVQQCNIAVVRDAAKTIQAFMNIIPSDSFNKREVTYDMLRTTKDAPPNINDFLLYSLLYNLKDEGYKILSLGLSPLVGLDEASSESSLISSVLRFAYVNGDRIYSFSGLHRFKEKYEPKWEDRFIGYRGGVRGFSRMLNGLASAMKVRNLKR